MVRYRIIIGTIVEGMTYFIQPKGIWMPRAKGKWSSLDDGSGWSNSFRDGSSVMMDARCQKRRTKRAWSSLDDGSGLSSLGLVCARLFLASLVLQGDGYFQ